MSRTKVIVNEGAIIIDSLNGSEYYTLVDWMWFELPRTNPFEASITKGLHVVLDNNTLEVIVSVVLNMAESGDHYRYRVVSKSDFERAVKIIGAYKPFLTGGDHDSLVESTRRELEIQRMNKSASKGRRIKS